MTESRLGPVEELPRHVARVNGVIPVAVELMTAEVDAGEFVVSHLNAGRITIGVDLATHRESGFGSRCGDQLHDHLMDYERLAAPILADEDEEVKSHPLRTHEPRQIEIGAGTF